MIVWVGTGKNAHNWQANDNALWGRKLIVRRNRIVKTGADGMIVGSSDGALIEHNVCSHDNPAGTLMIMNANPHLDNVIFRYNISQNDGAQNKFSRSIAIFEPRKAEIYKNVFVVTQGENGYRLSDQPGAAYRNNIFSFKGYTVGPQDYWPSAYPKRAVFEANCFAGHEPLVKDNKKLVADPNFVASGKGGDGLETVAGYRLQPESPCLNAGVPIPNNGDHDFFGNPISNQRPSAIEAHQPH